MVISHDRSPILTGTCDLNNAVSGTYVSTLMTHDEERFSVSLHLHDDWLYTGYHVQIGLAPRGIVIGLG